ncbi:MAG TPA: LytTR family DNA-binding domain-containing protein [Phnomibacter sp.]|nr:LytTR family DNA-binding domain-containing protein [Phnomibacter sp.]
MQVVIIEDEELTADRLAAMLTRYDPAIQVLATLPSVEGSVQWFTTNPTPDLVFMDIHLEDGQSFSIFEKINLDVPVIFTTAYDEYMIRAFKVNSVDYLMKPLNYDELTQAIEKYKRIFHATKEDSEPVGWQDLLRSLRQQEPEYKKRFLISIGSRLRTIDAGEIAYFYSAEKVTFLVTKDDQRFPLDISLDKLQTQMDPQQFFRINRQTLVGLDAIRNIHVYPKGRLKVDLQPAPKQDVMVSFDRVTEFKDWLGR